MALTDRRAGVGLRPCARWWMMVGALHQGVVRPLWRCGKLWLRCVAVAGGMCRCAVVTADPGVMDRGAAVQQFLRAGVRRVWGGGGN